MNTIRLSSVCLAAGLSALSTASAAFFMKFGPPDNTVGDGTVGTPESSAPGTIMYPGGSDLFGQFSLNIWENKLTLSATYEGTRSVQNLGTAAGNFEVKYEHVVVRVTGDGLTGGFKELDLGPVSGTVYGVLPSSTANVGLSKSGSKTWTTPDFTLSSGTGTYTLSWYMSGVMIRALNEKAFQDKGRTDEISGTLLVPEPATCGLVAGLGLVLFGLLRARRQ